MSLKCGIVGLPNVGKSTLFNALGSAKAEAANYPFCTIEPNVGIFNVPDARLEEISKIVHAARVVHATTQIVDIAGIVRGASKGEGLGNQFLSHIREVDAILHIVRCFVNDDIVHVEGSVDPKRDIDTIHTELLLADLQTLEKRLDRETRAAKTGDKEARKNAEVFEPLKKHMNEGNPARSFTTDEDARSRIAPLCLLTAKPVLYVANVTGKESERSFIETVKDIAQIESAHVLSIDCAVEAEIAYLAEVERKEYLEAMSITEPGLNRLIRAAFELLGLITYYTAGPKEARAWTIHQGTKAPQAAGVIHSDFERGFICAECMKSNDLLKLGSEQKVKEAGLVRTEGKDYIVASDDILLFRFNV